MTANESDNSGQSSQGRGNDRSNNNQGRRSNTSAGTTNRTNFKGDIAEMNGYIFTAATSLNPKHDYTKTLEALKTYVTQKCKRPEELMPLFENTPRNPEATKPEELSEEEQESKYKVGLYFRSLTDYTEADNAIKNGKLLIYQCVWGQCTEQMKSKLKGFENYENALTTRDCAWLLQKIKSIHYKFEDKKDSSLAIADALLDLVSNFQRPNMPLTSFYQTFKNKIAVIEHQGGDIGVHPALVHDILYENGKKDLSDKILTNKRSTLTDDEWSDYDDAKEQARELFLAKVFLRTVNRRRYGSLITELENDQHRGLDVLPKTITEAYELCQHDKRTYMSTDTGSETGLLFAQEGYAATDLVAGTDGRIYPHIVCYGCNKRGHRRPKCPSAATQTPDEPPPGQEG